MICSFLGQEFHNFFKKIDYDTNLSLRRLLKKSLKFTIFDQEVKKIFKNPRFVVKRILIFLINPWFSFRTSSKDVHKTPTILSGASRSGKSWKMWLQNDLQKIFFKISKNLLKNSRIRLHLKNMQQKEILNKTWFSIRIFFKRI